jgi:hypothetical protein
VDNQVRFAIASSIIISGFLHFQPLTFIQQVSKPDLQNGWNVGAIKPCNNNFGVI